MEEARCDKKLDSDRLFRAQKKKENFEIPTREMAGNLREEEEEK